VPACRWRIRQLHHLHGYKPASLSVQVDQCSCLVPCLQRYGCRPPLTLPVWAIKPWFGIGFHCAQLSSILGVLLYPILSDVARYAYLGPRTAAQAKPSNPNRAQTALKAGRRCALHGPIELLFLAPGPRS